MDDETQELHNIINYLVMHIVGIGRCFSLPDGDCLGIDCMHRPTQEPNPRGGLTEDLNDLGRKVKQLIAINHKLTMENEMLRMQLDSRGEYIIKTTPK